MLIENFSHILDALYAPRLWFMALSPYVSYTIIGVIITTLLAFSGWVLARLGYKPYWALLLLVPWGIDNIGVWLMAYRKFPREKLN